MRRTLGAVGAWLIATSIAIVVAWLGVRSVQYAAVPDRIEPLSAAEARKLAPTSPSPRADQTPVPEESPSPSSAALPSPTNNPASPGEPGWLQVPDGQGGVALQRTFEVTGGAATIRFTEDDVRVTATTPADGYEVSFDERGPTVAIVIFTSPQHISRLEASWEGGARWESSEADA